MVRPRLGARTRPLSYPAGLSAGLPAGLNAIAAPFMQ
jgi:hypothetical protein